MSGTVKEITPNETKLSEGVRLAKLISAIEQELNPRS